MDYREYTARSVDDAITQACMDFGVTSDRLDYQVVQEATSGFLGIGAKHAIIKACVRVEVAETPVEVEIPKMKSQKAADARAKEDPRRKEEKKPAVAEENRKALKKEVKKEQKEEIKVTAGPEENEELHPEEAGNVVITSDEIEKRAAAAAAKAKSEGRPEIPVHVEKREGGKRDRGHGHDRSRRRDEMRETETVRVHEPSRPKPERVIKPIPEEQAEELKNAAVAFLKSVFDAMKIDAEIEAEYIQEDGTVNCVFSGEEMGIIIGKRGQTLDSLQYLTSLVVNKKTEDYIRVKLDTEDYRARRADTLNNLARNIAYKVKKTHRSVALEPMNPYERRIIHSSLQGNRFVETYSEGEEPYRHVVVTPKR